MSIVIKIENLFKEYQLGVVGHGTLYRDMQSWWAKVRGKEDPNSLIGHANYGKNLDNILALNDINLEVKGGEVLGIIGGNGAGKSTLLKILSRITSPTSGLIKVKGRIASLLEVGTGFHGELTGKENIFLNGAINGMDKKEVSQKLDEIVDFAGVEQFLDTPVKRYSSGMYVRLGFAVAAYLEPDILVVDEVLAVGDASFQKKAIGKMQEVSEGEGRTVLFVSHNMDSISKLCKRVVVLSKGHLVQDGIAKESIRKYLGIKKHSKKYEQIDWKDSESAPGGDIVRLKSICTKDKKGKIRKCFSNDEDFIIELVYFVMEEGHQICNKLIFLQNDDYLFYSFDEYVQKPWGKQEPMKKGVYMSKCMVKGGFLNEGIIDIGVDIFIPPGEPDVSYQVRLPNILSIQIEDGFKPESARGYYPYDWHPSMKIRPKLGWTKEMIDSYIKR